MKRLYVLLLAAGCAPRAVVEERLPFDPARAAPAVVLHPGSRAWAMDPDVLQREVAQGLRAAGFAEVVELPPGEAGRGRSAASVRTEWMERPLEDEGDFVSPGLAGLGRPRRRFTGERVRAVLELHDERGRLLYRAVLIEDLSSALTEARVAEALLRPLRD